MGNDRWNLRLVFLAFIAMAWVGTPAIAVTDECAALMVANSAALDTLAGEIVKYQALSATKGKEIVASTLLDSINSAKAALIGAGIPEDALDTELERLIAAKQSGVKSDYDVAAANAELPKPGAPGATATSHTFTADELTALKAAVTYGELHSLSAVPAFKKAIAAKDDVAVKGFILGARNFEDACTALGSRCYRLEQDLSTPFPQGGTPLEFAIAQGNTNAAVMLVAAGGSGSPGAAVATGNAAVLGAMVGAGVPISDAELSKAIASKNLEVVKVIFDSGKAGTVGHFVELAAYPELISQFERVLLANPSFLNGVSGKLTPVVSAIRAKNRAALTLLIGHNVDLDKAAAAGELEPLAEGVNARDTANVQLMINARVGLDSSQSSVKKSPLGIAIANHDTAMVKLCITAGVDLKKYEYMKHFMDVLTPTLVPTYSGSTNYKWDPTRGGDLYKTVDEILPEIKRGRWHYEVNPELKTIGLMLLENWAK